MKDNKKILADIVAEAAEKTFSAYDAPLTPSEAPNNGHEIVAVIGYAADEVRGGIAVGISEGLARRTMPTGNVPIYDWVGELANQILGRARNQLIAYRVNIQIATPVVLHGLGVRVAPPGDGSARVNSYSFQGEIVQVLAEARFEQGFEFPEPETAVDVVDEGEMLFF
jgi:CheY-specific phosphatase CheX